MTAEQLFRLCISSLTPSLGEREARSVAKIIFEDVRGMSQTDLAVYGDRVLEDFTVNHINDIVKKINDGMPVQYAVGSARFCGMDFKVNKSVLIPRPETEWIVDRICDDYHNNPDLQILDCGTGSGCIAISLARALAFANVTAIDISSEALNIAEKNAVKFGTNIKFVKEDILKLHDEQAPKYDIIVSNPPYIANSEKDSIDSRVKDYEPAKALFVSDSNPLIFYTAIANYGLSALKRNGRIYFEINPLFASKLKESLMQIGYESIDIYRDMFGHERYAVVSRK